MVRSNITVSRSMTIPNFLTFLRMMLIPVMVVIFYLPWKNSHYLCALIFFLAGLTDWLDGMLARRWKQTTQFGAFIDPVADKLMVAVSLAMLIQGFNTAWVTIPAIIIIGREIVISALREWMAEIGKRNSIAVNMMGKLKTLAQMLAIFMLLFAGLHIFNWFTIAGLIALYVAAALTLWSMCVYLMTAWKTLKNQ